MNTNTCESHDVHPLYARCLSTLVYLCEANNIGIQSITAYCHGFKVVFEGHEEGDAIIHDYSYCSAAGMWETMGFPWDYGDVSVHDTRELVALVKGLQK